MWLVGAGLVLVVCLQLRSSSHPNSEKHIPLMGNHWISICLYKYRKISLKKIMFLAYKYGYKREMEVAPSTCVFSECSRNLIKEVSVSSQLTSMCWRSLDYFMFGFFSLSWIVAIQRTITKSEEHWSYFRSTQQSLVTVKSRCCNLGFVRTDSSLFPYSDMEHFKYLSIESILPSPLFSYISKHSLVSRISFLFFSPAHLLVLL